MPTTISGTTGIGTSNIIGTGGIGLGTETLSPGVGLEIKGNISYSSIVLNNSTPGTGRNWSILSGNGGLFRITDLTGSPSTDRLRIDTNGNVGIGTNSLLAGYKLDVVGGYVSSRMLDGNMSRFSLINSTRHWSVSNYGTQFSLNNYFVIADETAAAARLFISPDGIVGVGTSTQFTPNNTFVANMGLAVTTETGSTLTPMLQLVRRDNAVDRKIIRVGNFNGGHFVVEHVNDIYSTATNLFYIEGSPNRGRVGIGGMTAPDQMLTVSGNASKSAGGTTWAIYSDIRIKKDITIADTDRCYNIVKNLPLKRYTLKDEIFSAQEVKDRSKLGWIAQDIESFFPKGVYKNTTTFSPTKLSADNVIIEDCMSFDADQVYAAMYGAIQKLINKIEVLETKISELESK